MEPAAFAVVGIGALALGAAVVAAVVALAIWLFIRSTNRKALPVALLLIGFCLESVFVKQPYLQLGLQIYPNDVISLFVLLSVLAGVFRRPVPVHDSPFLLWLALGGSIILSFIVGLSEYGRYAGTEVRPFFYLWVAGLYCSMAEFDAAELRRIGQWCQWAAYAFIGIAVYHWAVIEIGWVGRKELFGDEADVVFRPVGSHAVFFVSAVAMVMTMAWLRGTGSKRSGLHAAILLAFVVILQHRSVWIAAAAGLLCVMVLERRHLPSRFPLLLAFVLVVTLGTSIAAWFGYLDELGRRMLQSTVSMTSEEGTFAARVDGWVRLWESWADASNRVIAFGFPFGQGYTRYYKGQLIEFAPHNFYLDLILRVGVLGLVLFTLPTLMAIVHGYRAKTESEFDYLLTRGLAVGLTASLVYYVAYPSYYILGGATGILIARMVAQRRLRASAPKAADILPIEPPRAQWAPPRNAAGLQELPPALQAMQRRRQQGTETRG